MRESNKVWQPSESRIAEANITKFIEHINRQGFDLKNYADLHQWSLDHNEQFWQEVWLFCDVIGNAGETVKSQAESKWQQPVLNRDLCWFPDAHINYAENLLSFAYQNHMSSPSGLKMSVTNDRPIRGNSCVMKSRVFNSGLGIVASNKAMLLLVTYRTFLKPSSRCWQPPA